MARDGYRPARHSCCPSVLSKLFRRLFLTELLALHQARRIAFYGSMEPPADRRAFLRHLSGQEEELGRLCQAAVCRT